MATDITDNTDLTVDTATNPAVLPPPSQIDMKFASTFNAAVLIIVGFYMTFLGYSRNHAGTKARLHMKRLHMFLVGYAFVSIVMVQIQYFGGLGLEKNMNLWIVYQVVLPLGGSIVAILFNNVAVFGIGIHVALLLANLLTDASSVPQWIDQVFPRPILIQTVGFVGGIICLALEMETYYLLLSFVSAACGASFLLEGINCFVKQVPAIRPFDYKAESYVCNPSLPVGGLSESADKIIFFASVFGGAVIGLIIQALFAVAIVKMFHKKPKRKPAPQVEKHAKHNRPQVSGEKPSLWHFIRHRGEYLSFRTHLKHLARRLEEMCLNQRETTSSGHYADDSQYVVLADQLTLLTQHEHQPSTIHHEAIKWLEDKQNWDLLLSQPDDLFEMKHLNRLEYTKLMHEDPWGDFITLQAIIQVYEIPVNVISSIWDPPLVEFLLIPQKRQQPAPIKQKQDKALKLGVKFIEESEIMDAVPEGVITLVGADGKAVRCFKAVVMRSSTISTFVQEAAEENMSVITFDEDPSLTGDVLFRICKRLEAMHVMEETAKMDDIPDAPLKYLDLDHIFVPEERKAVKPMYVSHYWGYHYGSLEAAPKKDRPTVLAQSAPQMRIFSRPHTRMALNRVTHIGIILAGIWWIIWMLVWGYRFDSFVTGLQFILFWLAETVNFVLGIIYNMNFWQPIKRKWKSLDKLTPPFVKHIIVNCMIFHYSEDPKDTGRTLGGAFRMKLTQGTTLRVWICDDGFWVYPKKPAAKQKTLLDKIADAVNSCRRKFKQPQPAPAAVEMADLNAEAPPPLPTEIPKAKSDYKPTWPGEEDMVNFIRNTYGCVPKNEVKDMLAMIKQEVYRYYSEKLHCRVNVNCKIEIGTIDNGEVVRSDCAKATVHYHFYAEYYGRIAGPEVIIVGRVKPDKHHYKAGNINNAIYNSKMEGEFAILLDNDMKPTADFILRTVPWFYYFNEETQNYHINKGIAFIQSPQFFKASTIAQGHDFLGGNNSVFFQGIQVGRDGFDLCAFAGTNAIFSLTAMRSVNGLPYGSLTEDANLAIFLHRFGFRSVYVEDRLAVGIAPVTVANSMQQRSRWVKGSVQILMNNLSCGPRNDEIHWEHDSPYEVYTQKDVEPFGIPSSKKGKHNLFRIAYALDTMLYPFSAVTAIFYMIIAFLFLVVAEAPLNFTRPPFSYQAFLVTFLPFFLLKSISTFLSYNRVNPNDVWVAQEVWFSFSFAALWGIIDACKEAVTGSGLGGWGVTGEGKRSSNMEWFNTIVLFLLSITIFIRFLVFLTDPAGNITVVAAVFFSITVVIQMWPMVGTSLYEWVHNSHLPVDEKVDLHRYEIPNYIIFYFILVLGIFVSVFAIGSLSGVGQPT